MYEDSDTSDSEGMTSRGSNIASLPAEKRVFLFLQGPHGPFFSRLGEMLRATGASVLRVGFNAGDRRFWADEASFIAHPSGPDGWPEALAAIIAERRVTDVVLYGDTRPVHAEAVRQARAAGLVCHVFEEGYLRPFWISYERGGSNGHSPLMNISLSRMERDLTAGDDEVVRPPAHWGDMNHHKFYGALYHFYVVSCTKAFPGWKSHRDVSVWSEFRFNLHRFLLSPFIAVERGILSRRIRQAGHPFTLVLMQLAHDSSLREHSDYSDQKQFAEECIAAFSENAPKHHHLVFKAHPLEDGRAGGNRIIKELSRKYGVEGRVHYVPGGKVAAMLAQARAVVTVNSTAAQQALWRGLPVKAMGRAVYDKPGLVSGQTLGEFMVTPERPDRQAYRTFRQYLLETSQVPGGFYATRSRAHALRIVIDLMLAEEGPYAALSSGKASFRQQISNERD